MNRKQYLYQLQTHFNLDTAMFEHMKLVEVKRYVAQHFSLTQQLYLHIKFKERITNGSNSR